MDYRLGDDSDDEAMEMGGWELIKYIIKHIMHQHIHLLDDKIYLLLI